MSIKSGNPQGGKGNLQVHIRSIFRTLSNKSDAAICDNSGFQQLTIFVKKSRHRCRRGL